MDLIQVNNGNDDFRINHFATDLSKCRNALSTTHAYRLLIAFSKKLYGIECNYNIEDITKSDTIWIDFDYNELVEIMNLNIYNKTEANRIVCESFEHLTKRIMFRPDGWDKYSWVSDSLVYKHFNKDGVYKIMLSALCVNMLNGLKGYTKLEIENLCKLESNQQSFIYLFLKSHARLKSFTISIDSLLIALKLHETKSYKSECKRWISNIRDRVFGIDKNGNYLIDKQGNFYGCLYNINTKTDITVTVEFIRKGIKDYDIKFEIIEKTPKPEKTQLTLNAPKQETQIQPAPDPEPIKGAWHEVSQTSLEISAKCYNKTIEETISFMLSKGLIKFDNGKLVEFRKEQ